MDLVVAVFIYLLIGMVVTIWAYHDDDEADLPSLILSVVAWLPMLIVTMVKLIKRK